MKRKLGSAALAVLLILGLAATTLALAPHAALAGDDNGTGGGSGETGGDDGTGGGSGETGGDDGTGGGGGQR